MAKKIFCDVCGDEMAYEAVPPYLKGQDVPVRVKGHDGDLEFSVHVKVIPEGVANGQHVDVCGDCRAHLLDKLDMRPKPDEPRFALGKLNIEELKQHLAKRHPGLKLTNAMTDSIVRGVQEMLP